MRGAVAATFTSVAIRQGAQIVFGLLLARVVGPDQYAVVAAASIYVVFAALVMDQGLSAALVQKPVLPPAAPGALATINLLVGGALAVATWLAAPALASALNIPDLTFVLRVLGAALLLKAATVMPRAMLARRLRFSALATLDVVATGAGAVTGVLVLAAGAGTWAYIAYIVTTDVAAAVLLTTRAQAPRPNWDLAAARDLLPFGSRVLVTNALAFVSSNADGLLIARYLGARDLALYSIAFRVLVVPVVLLGQTVNRVLFPVISRAAGDPRLVAETVLAATKLLAAAAIPLMAWVACMAPTLTPLILGPAWSPAVPLVSVLAVAGARESVFFLTPALLRGMGRSGLNLRFQLLSTIVQVIGVVAGLPFGTLGVAVGYTVAGFVLTPVIMALQRRVAGVSCRQQVAAFMPAVHASGWAVAAFLASSSALGGGLVASLAGSGAFASALVAVLALAHRRWLLSGLAMLRRTPLTAPRSEGEVVA